MKVFVTGASGFIGRRLIQHLLGAGHSVVAAVRRPCPDLDPARVRVVQVRLDDRDELRRGLEGCDAVVHLAVATGTTSEREAFAVNVVGTEHLLEAAKSAGVRRFIFASTISATRERMGPYGRTKQIAEQRVAASGIPYCTIRPSLVYGGREGLVANLTAYLRGLPFIPVMGDGTIELDPIHVDDVCAAILAALTEDRLLGRAYDLLGPDRVTFNQFLDRLSAGLGVKRPYLHIPGPVALMLARVLAVGLKRPPITEDNVLGMISAARVDRGPAMRDFPVTWTPLDRGLLGHSSNPPRAVPAASVTATRDAPSRSLRVGIVGLGKMGMVHGSVLAMMPEVELVAFVDQLPGMAKTLYGMGHRAPFFPSLEEALRLAKPDAVWICTPPDSHAALTELAVRAGVAVFVEKPLAHNLADAVRIETAAREGGVPVACGYAQLYFPSFSAAREALADGVLGTLRKARSSMFLSQVFAPQKGWIGDPARSGGGVVANLSSHLLSQLRGAFGQPVRARATWKKLYGQVEDELTGVLVMADGAEVAFESSWSVPNYPISSTVIEAEGDNGTLRITNDAFELDLREARGQFPAGRSLRRAADLPARATFDLNGEFYDLEDADFLAWVSGAAKPRIEVGLGADVQRTMSALYESAARDGEEVAVAR
ncbi:MAG: Gfo/Idh/MocA family oxidoreductase [Candidatus Eisenbacteria bacterium]